MGPSHIYLAVRKHGFSTGNKKKITDFWFQMIPLNLLQQKAWSDSNWPVIQKGLAPLLHRGAALADIESLIIEFQLVIGTKLSCIDSSENSDSLIVTNAVSNLLSAMVNRLQLEVADSRVRLFQARKLDLEKENQQKFDAPLLSQDLSKDQAVNNFLAVEKAAPVFSGI